MCNCQIAYLKSFFWRNKILLNGGALNRAFFSDSSSFYCWIERSLKIFVNVFLWLYLSRYFWWNSKSFPTLDFRRQRTFPESEIIQWNHLVQLKPYDCKKVQLSYRNNIPNLNQFSVTPKIERSVNQA